MALRRAAASSLAVATAAFGLASCSLPSRFPDTPLFEGVRQLDFEAQEALLRRRVEAKYRVGQPEAGLEGYLRSQGLKTRRITSSGAPGTPIYGESSARDGFGVCDRIVHINWRADSGGVIRELLVVAGDTGCF